MLIKEADNKKTALNKLQILLERSDLSPAQQKAITIEAQTLRESMRVEREAAYELDLHYKNSKNFILLHDLHLEVDGGVAQIDHLLMDRTLCIYIFETKSFSSGVKINELGEFSSWNSDKKIYQSIPSPLAQNERHIRVLNDFFKTNTTPTRLGIKLDPKIIPFVLISNKSHIERPQNFDTKSVIKCYALFSTRNNHIHNSGTKQVLGSLNRLVSRGTLAKVGRLLKQSHKPITPNYIDKFDLSEMAEPKPTNLAPKIELAEDAVK